MEVKLMAKLKKGLTQRERLFAELYVTTGNATQSYIKAYDKTYEKVDDKQYVSHKVNACNLLKKQEVRDYVEELTSQRSPLANENWIIDKLLEIINNPDAKDADKLKAMDTILKCLGSYTTNQNINAKVENTGEMVIKVTVEDDDIEDDEDAD